MKQLLDGIQNWDTVDGMMDLPIFVEATVNRNLSLVMDNAVKDGRNVETFHPVRASVSIRILPKDVGDIGEIVMENVLIKRNHAMVSV